MKARTLSIVRILLSLTLLTGMVWQAAAADLPDVEHLEARSRGTQFLDQKELKGNCRVHVQEIYHSGKKKLHVADVESYSRGECKSEALLRKISSSEKEDVKEVRVYFSFREPAVLE